MALKLRKNNAPAPPNMCPLSHCMSLLGGAWTPQHHLVPSVAAPGAFPSCGTIYRPFRQRCSAPAYGIWKTVRS